MKRIYHRFYCYYFALKFSLKGLLFLTSLLLVMQILSSLIPYTQLLIIERLFNSLPSGNDSPDSSTVLLLIVGWGTVALVEMLFSVGERMVSTLHSEKLIERVDSSVQSKCIRIRFEKYDTPDYHDQLHRVATHASRRLQSTINQTAHMIRSLFHLLSISFVITRSIPACTPILLLVCMFPGVIYSFKNSKKVYQYFFCSTKIMREVNLLQQAILDRNHAKENRIYQMNLIYKRKYFKYRNKYRKYRLKIEIQQAYADTLKKAGSAGFITLFLWLLIRTAFSKRMMTGQVVMMFQAAQRILSATEQLFLSIDSIYSDLHFLEMFHDFLTQPEEPCKVHVVEKELNHLEVRNLTFRYPQAAKTVLHQINMSFYAGKIIALAGPNGSGKSTILKILCGLYEPTEGAIYWNGKNINDVDRSSYWTNIDSLFQSTPIVPLTIKEFLESADSNGAVSSVHFERMHEILAISGAEQVISGLPMKEESQLNHTLQDGVELSSGQWQRLLLARTLARGNKLLVLDEPTNALDVETETALFNYLKRRRSSDCIIYTSHRASALKNADIIYWMEDGSVLCTDNIENERLKPSLVEM